jgi:MscS family membrane protein
MYVPVVMWNPINLIDGEGHWVSWELGFLLSALVISKAIGIVLRSLSKKIQTSAFFLFAEAIYLPVISLIWYLVALFSFDLVTEDFLSQGHPKLWAVLTNGGAVIFLGWFLLRFKNRWIILATERRTQEGKSPDPTSMQALSKLFTVGIGAIILVLLNDCTGLSFTTLLAFGGVGGLAFAFASQEIVSNFFGGFMIHMTRPFLIGELVAMPSLNIEGVVEEIGWYQTRIRPQSKSAVYIPNSLFTKALLINKTRTTHHLINETIYINAPSVLAITQIAADLDAYLASHAQLDQSDGPFCRIDALGPTATLVLTGLACTASLKEFYRLRSELLCRTAHIVETRGGHMAPAPLTIPTSC